MYTGEDVGIVYIYIYLGNPPMQNYRSKSETAIIVASCLKYRCFQFFVAVWMVFFAVSTPANTCKGRKIQNLLTSRKTCPQQ